MKQLLRAEAPSKNKASNVNTNSSMAEINRCIYLRHALKYGAKSLKVLRNPQKLRSTFFPEFPGTGGVKMTLDDAKLILKEEFRLGCSPRREHFRAKIQKYWDRTREYELKRLELEALAKQESSDAEDSEGTTTRLEDENTTPTSSSA